MARDSRVLDLNTSYAYLLWARDFAATSIVATVDDEPAGFVSGYLRPEDPSTFMLWQVAVDEKHRGLKIARRMIDEVIDRQPASVTTLETTITDDNAASIALFASFARGREAELVKSPLFEVEHFPDSGHGAEFLYRIGPFAR